jgi:hypothetical protein
MMLELPPSSCLSEAVGLAMPATAKQLGKTYVTSNEPILHLSEEEDNSLRSDQFLSLLGHAQSPIGSSKLSLGHQPSACCLHSSASVRHANGSKQIQTRTEQDKREKEAHANLNGLLEKARNQEELVMQLKIRVAVLENQLAHIEQEREEAVRACGIVARALSSTSGPVAIDAGMNGFGANEMHSSVEKWEILEREIEKLQKANALCRKIDGYNSGSNSDALVDSDNEIKDSKVRGRLYLRDHISNLVSGEGEERIAEREETFGDGEFVHSDESRNLSPHATRNQSSNAIVDTPTVSENPTSSFNSQDRFSSEAVTIENNVRDQDLDSGDTTVPSSPTIPANDNIYSQISFKDVGLESLDDIIGPEGSDLPLPVGPLRVPSNATKDSQLLEEKLGIDEDTKIHMSSMISSQDLPSPIILRTGFDFNGSFRGGDYDHTNRRGSKGYERFALSTELAYLTAYDSPTSEIRDILNGTDMIRSSVNERDAAIVSHRRHSSYNGGGDVVDFFRYGIRYVPPETTSSYVRRIIISNLPRNIDLRGVLARIRGGDIVSADLLDTEKLTGGMTAMVQFLHESSAQEYITYWHKHPIYFGPSDQKAEVTLVQTPTWPLTTGSHRSILERNQTRCLAIPAFPEHLSITALERNVSGHNGFQWAALLDVYTDEQETLHLEFSSMRAANSAYSILSQWQIYRQLNPFFTPDPCAGSVEELALPLPPRLHILRRKWDSIQPPQSLSDSRNENKEPDVGIDQREPLAALSGQKVTIPSFCGLKLKSSSWADEMIQEAESEDPSLPNDTHDDSSIRADSPVLSSPKMHDEEEGMSMTIHAVSVENVNRLMGDKNPSLRKLPAGLAASRWASIIHGSSDLLVAHKRQVFSIGAGNEANTFREGKKSLSPDHDASGGIKDPSAHQNDIQAVEADLTSTASTYQTQTDAEVGVLQTPERVHLDLLLESSPSQSSTSSSSLNIPGPAHNEQHSAFSPSRPHETENLARNLTQNPKLAHTEDEDVKERYNYPATTISPVEDQNKGMVCDEGRSDRHKISDALI